MKAIFTILLLPLLICCNKHGKDIDFFLKYQYPLDSLKTPKVFIFHRTDSVDLKMNVYFKLLEKENNSYVIKSFLGRGMRDSCVFLNNESLPLLSERYMITKNKNTKIEKVSKGKIVDLFNDGYKSKSIIQYTGPFNEYITTTCKSVSVFDNSLVYQLTNENIECIRYKDSTKISIKHKYFSHIGSTIEHVGESIMGEGLGIIYFSNRNNRNGNVSCWELERIIDFRDYKKQLTGANIEL